MNPKRSYNNGRSQARYRSHLSAILAGILLLLSLTPGVQAKTFLSTEDFSQRQQRQLLEGTVRIVNHGRGVGTGAVIAHSPRKSATYVLTARHVVRPAGRISIELFTVHHRFRSLRTLNSDIEIVAELPEHDLAVLRAPCQEAPPAIIPVCPPRLAPSGPVLSALSAGCPLGRRPTLRTVLLSTESDQRWTSPEGGIGGLSGSPIVNDRGLLVAVHVARHRVTRESQAVPLRAIHDLLDQCNLRHLYLSEQELPWYNSELFSLGIRLLFLFLILVPHLSGTADSTVQRRWIVSLLLIAEPFAVSLLWSTLYQVGGWEFWIRLGIWVGIICVICSWLVEPCLMQGELEGFAPAIVFPVAVLCGASWSVAVGTSVGCSALLLAHLWYRPEYSKRSTRTGQRPVLEAPLPKQDILQAATPQTAVSGVTVPPSISVPTVLETPGTGENGCSCPTVIK